MNTQLGIEWEAYDCLRDDYNETRCNLKHIQRERKGVHTECNMFKAEADLLQAEALQLQTLNQELASQVP